MVLFALGFTIGVWLLQQQAALPDFGWAWLLLIMPLVLLIPARNQTLRITRALLLFGLACALGFYHAAWQAEQRLSTSLADEWQGRDIMVIGVVAELPRRHEQGQRFSFTVEKTLTPNARVPQHIYLSTYFDRQTAPLRLRAGERWQLTLRLKQPHGSSNPHSFDFEAWALENNIRAVGYVHNKSNNLRINALADGPAYRIEAWRETVRDKFDAALKDAPYAGVLSALAIGDQNSIPAAQWQVFTRTGVNHLMSISGLHITMLASFGFALTYWLWRRSARLTLRLPARKAAAVAALLVALGYALLSGYAVPAQRTVYMVAAVAAALWLKRNFSPGQILAIALLGVLLPDPWAVLSPGFWLSFGAVALILYVTAYRIGKTHSQCEGDSVAASQQTARHTSTYPMQMLREYASVQWAMTIGLIPLLLALFQQVSLVSPFANSLAIPLVSLVVVPLTLLGALLPFDAPLWLAHQVMSAVMVMLEWMSALPQAVWVQHAPPAWSVAAGMLGAVWLLLPRGFPMRWLGMLLMLPMFLNTPDAPPQGTLRLVVFDVGQGLAVAAQTQHHALLYDTGPDSSGEANSGNRILVPALRALGISKLDGLILTHDDSDHTGGAASVMQAMPIDWVSSSLTADRLKTVLAAPAARPPAGDTPAQARGRRFRRAATITSEIRRCQDGDSWEWDGVLFEMLHPAPTSYAALDTPRHDNEQGCVLLVSNGAQHILLTADIEAASERRLIETYADKLHARLLLVPHHGSKTSSTPEFVAAVSPDYAVFTVGYRNRFGHPKTEVLQRYRDGGAQLLRSDEDGALLVEMDAHDLRVVRYRATQRRYWTHTPSARTEGAR